MVLEGVSRGPFKTPSKTLQKPFRDPSETLLGSGGSVAGNESLDPKGPKIEKIQDLEIFKRD